MLTFKVESNSRMNEMQLCFKLSQVSVFIPTWFMVFSICTRPRLGSVVFMKSTMDSRLSCCRSRGLWLPSRLKATLKITSEPWRNNISGKERKKKAGQMLLNKRKRKTYSTIQMGKNQSSDVKTF